MSFEVGDGSPVTAFATSSTQLAAGSDCRVLVWDLAAAKPYMLLAEAHADLVTRLHYYPADDSQLYTGSEDGMVNTFNTHESDADLALLSTTPINRCVDDFGFYGAGLEKLWVLTSDEDLSMWKLETCEELFRTPDIRQHVCLSRPPEYCVGVNYLRKTDQLVVMTGFGSGELQLYNVGEDGSTEKFSEFSSHSAVVRTWNWDVERDVHFTGGEDGLLCQWSLLPPTPIGF